MRVSCHSSPPGWCFCFCHSLNYFGLVQECDECVTVCLCVVVLGWERLTRERGEEGDGAGGAGGILSIAA